jgi:hypothetical protein
MQSKPHWARVYCTDKSCKNPCQLYFIWDQGNGVDGFRHFLKGTKNSKGGMFKANLFKGILGQGRGWGA